MYKVTYCYTRKIGTYNGFKKAPEVHEEKFEVDAGEFETEEAARKHPNIDIEKEYPTGYYKIVKVS